MHIQSALKPAVVMQVMCKVWVLARRASSSGMYGKQTCCNLLQALKVGLLHMCICFHVAYQFLYTARAKTLDLQGLFIAMPAEDFTSEETVLSA